MLLVALFMAEWSEAVPFAIMIGVESDKYTKKTNEFCNVLEQMILVLNVVLGNRGTKIFTRSLYYRMI